MKRGAWCSVVVTAVLVAAVEVVSGGPAREARQAYRCSNGLQCAPLSTCQSFLGPDNKPDPTLMRRLRAEFCQKGFSEDPKVCCPQVVSTTTQPGTGGSDLLPAQCGRTTENRIFHGTVASPNEYPWMALLGYGSINDIRWDCGGVLINDRYVLTAAHCVHTDFTFGATVSTVRLGEHNTETDPDCNIDKRPCSISHQDFSPESITIHETFHKRSPVSDDIALIRLDRKAALVGSVLPVCVPSADLDVPTFLAGRKGVVAGWGATENSTSSSVLRKVQVPYVEKSKCEPHYPGELVPEQVCFGGEGNQDSCYGDSGGPLFQADLESISFNVLGLVSRGKGDCGIVGVPAVYTNVASYRSWILNNIKP